MKNERIVIIEGIPALANPKVLEMSDVSFFLDLSDSNFRKQFQKLYTWKGYSNAEIASLLEIRQRDEVEIIRQSATNADHILNLL